MTIDPKQLLFNQPILKIREIVRKFYRRAVPDCNMNSIIEEFSGILNQPKSIAKEVLDQMLEEKYLMTEIERFDDKNYLCFKETQKGHLLSISKANPAITPSKAKLLVKELRERVNELNENDDFAYKVKHVKVLGSFSLKHNGLRDVDVAIWLKQRIEGDEFNKKMEERIKLAFEKGRRLDTYNDQADWPVQEVKLYLKIRKKGLNLHFVNVFSFN